LQDEATQSVIAAVEPNLRFAEVARKIHVPTQHLNAYDLYLRSLAEFDSFTRNGLTAAEGLLRRAVEIDPNYSDAWTLLAQTLFHQLIGGWRAGTDAIEEAKQAALIGAKVGPENGLVHAVAGTYPMLFGGSIEEAVELADRAIALHPNSEVVRQCAGWTFLFSGEFDTALEHLETGLRIAPLGRGLGILLHGIALARFFQRDFDSAIDQAKRALVKMSENPNVWRVKAAALAHVGRIDEARDALRQLLALAPKSSLSTMRTNFRHRWMRDLYLDGLRKAGLPE
jgi:adenylate cyclase